MTIVVRTPLDVASVMARNKEARCTEQPATSLSLTSKPCSRLFHNRCLRSDFPMILLGAFAALALLLASVGHLRRDFLFGGTTYSLRLDTYGAWCAQARRFSDGGGARPCSGSRGPRHRVVAALILPKMLSSYSHLLYGVTASDPASSSPCQSCCFL